MAKNRLLIGTDVRVRETGGSFLSAHTSLSDDSLSKFHGVDLDLHIVARRDPRESSSPWDAGQRVQRGAFTLLETERSRFRLVRLLTTLVSIVRLDVASDDVVFVRLPEVVGTLLAIKAIQKRSKFVVNVVAEPYAYAGKFGPLSSVASRALTMFYSLIACRANAAVYVTESTLQAMLPYRGPGRTYSVSNVRVPIDALATEIKDQCHRSKFLMVSTGTMNSNVKGFDSLIRSLAIMRSRNVPAWLRVIGDGDSRAQLDDLASELGVGDFVQFCGYIGDTDAVRTLLSESSLFILASRQEGLPRAMIEAMACGIPAIGSAVGGIPELVPEEYLFEPGDPDAIAKVVSRLHSNPDQMMQLAERQLAHASNIVRVANSDVFVRCISEL